MRPLPSLQILKQFIRDVNQWGCMVTVVKQLLWRKHSPDSQGQGHAEYLDLQLNSLTHSFSEPSFMKPDDYMKQLNQGSCPNICVLFRTPFNFMWAHAYGTSSSCYTICTLSPPCGQLEELQSAKQLGEPLKSFQLVYYNEYLYMQLPDKTYIQVISAVHILFNNNLLGQKRAPSTYCQPNKCLEEVKNCDDRDCWW